MDIAGASDFAAAPDVQQRGPRSQAPVRRPV